MSTLQKDISLLSDDLPNLIRLHFPLQSDCEMLQESFSLRMIPEKHFTITALRPCFRHNAINAIPQCIATLVAKMKSSDLIILKQSYAFRLML